MTFHLRETIIRRAPLAVRCIDVVRDQPVSNDLHLEVYLRDHLTQPTVARPSPVSGFFGVRTLPELRDYVTNAKDASAYCSPNLSPEDEHQEANFVLLIQDKQQRFLPATLVLCLPKTHVVPVDLHSSPARSPIAGMASIYGEIWDASADAPAAWSVVRVTPPSNNPVRAIADARGMFQMMLPHPGPKKSGVLHEMKWVITCEVLYKLDDQLDVSPRMPPDMRSILNQGTANIHDVPDGDGKTSIERSLLYQTPLVLRTENENRLMIEPQ
ncbi:MAG: hypothetical protein GF344_20530 [Chitinivibrionales bacterium]|nr:hypothetical protein [Chitinivibrionales bacterium]MBD3358989.1 hypothetical protein [Chitinivibrionales bacterium]